ncbi:uncharacterized protein B0H64DRAFT_202144 [Chaetomium fimeti]|uniref:Uncharacterized protein n=1 Tax=Chaetomium fimeti TaxID=1854472 RepID=A0AAE0HAE3_9PEZI|nr:hypothetical protein B0H64DRAFT_202144 [Chaetomium fimeti]
MSRSISWLRSTRSSPGRGSQCLLGGHSTVPTWGASTTTRARIGRIANVQKTQTSRPFSRSFSTHKSANDNGRTSRFKKSEASLTEPLRRADGENTPTEPTPTHPASSEPVGSSTTTYQPAPSPSPRSQGPADANPQIPPKARKPVDTSSKEYKQAASRYIRFVVAFPVLVVTSYFLYERLKPQLKLRVVPAGSSSTQDPTSGS